MIAIPLDSENSTHISDLYGNAPYFAFLNEETGSFNVSENDGCGNGLDTAKFVTDSGASDTVFFHMGEGVFKYLDENGVSVLTVKKEPLSIDQIYMNYLDGSFEKVLTTNAKTLLDPGTASCSCECHSN